MGAKKSKCSEDSSGEVNFDHFQVLRAIGGGSFGKVCIVKKKDTKEMYAMKYMSKTNIIAKKAGNDVLRELKILTTLDHPFLVRLWFSFQDEEDLFLVMDLLLGGDLRFHLGQQKRFSLESVRLYMAEMVLALHYLKDRNIMHRDVKPSNMLLDDGGHCHLTDFSVAFVVQSKRLPKSIAGTRPYMAPEMVGQDEHSKGYCYAVDWWSLGVCLFELLRGKRPFCLLSTMDDTEMAATITTSPIKFPTEFDLDAKDLLLESDPTLRREHVKDIHSHSFFKSLDWNQVEQLKVQPSFVPCRNEVHCDPYLEFEELLVESKPLHKKKQRLKKMPSRSSSVTKLEPAPNPDCRVFRRSASHQPKVMYLFMLIHGC
ncbi:serine/threonine-protein kinase 32A-like isoform X2 [Corticium candelabrum]|uniref:serine/threonine-protein kinase 32A-like isoform X2 n=1 Tax=Corticium candelabrum TaxID=121492 RepID=UPI002E25CBA5|nr:serine/threonine-protein kinase 32A-like isoform X2 [Corticium candelabrum]